MSDILFGGEVSGTPLETRDGTSNIAAQLIQMLGDPSQGAGRLVTGSQMNTLGFDPSSLGLGDVVKRSLQDPASRTSGLFASLEPFERRSRDQAVSDLRGGFGRLGGRFSSNRDTAEAELIQSLNQGFMRTREEALISAQGEQNQALAQLFQAMIGSAGIGVDQLQALLQFFQPGAPNFREGILGDVIGAAGNLGAAKVTGG